jgi:hypothetical protein
VFHLIHYASLLISKLVNAQAAFKDINFQMDHAVCFQKILIVNFITQIVLALIVLITIILINQLENVKQLVIYVNLITQQMVIAYNAIKDTLYRLGHA